MLHRQCGTIALAARRYPLIGQYCSLTKRAAYNVTKRPLHSPAHALQQFEISKLIPKGGTLARSITTQSRRNWKKAYVGLGSNVGDRPKLIEAACRDLDHGPDVHMIRTSGLWETKAMYVTDQGDFLNGVCEV